MDDWLSIDPKQTAFESPYNSMSNNPILYNDKKGDTISFKGNREDSMKLLNSLMDQLGKGNLLYSFSYDSNNEISGFKAYGATAQKDGSLNEFLADVVNSTENIQIVKTLTKKSQLDNEVKNRGGMMFTTDPKTIQKFAGKEDFKSVIFITDSYFRDFKGNGDGRPREVSWLEVTGWMLDNRVDSRPITFAEALFHETIHAYRWIHNQTLSVNELDENTVISIMNKWRVKNNLHERALYEYHEINWWNIMEMMMGDKSGWRPKLFTYDDWKNEKYNYRGDKRENTPNKID